MIARIGPVATVSATGAINDAKVYRNDHVPTAGSGGISVWAAHTDLLSTVGGTLSHGAFLNDATAHFPAAVLGANAARCLGVGDAGPRQQVWPAGHWYTVVGVLRPVPSPKSSTTPP